MIKASVLKQVVKDLAAAYPDRRESCVYITKEENGALVPCCIVGHALVRLGVRAEEIYADEDLNGGTPVAELYDDLEFDNIDALLWLSNVQDLQDKDHTWGEAVRHSRRWDK